MDTKTTAIYLRVSSDMQTTKNQKPEIDQLISARGLKVIKTYDEQASAAKFRPEFERMMADAREGKFKTLVVWALDRFGRSMAGNINDVLALDKLGIKVISVREPWMDTAGPVRELLIAIFSWAAQQERARLIERTKAGIAVARADGKPWGRRSEKLVTNEVERERIMTKWTANKKPGGYAGLALQLGGCSPMTARKLWLGRAA